MSVWLGGILLSTSVATADECAFWKKKFRLKGPTLLSTKLKAPEEVAPEVTPEVTMANTILSALVPAPYLPPWRAITRSSRRYNDTRYQWLCFGEVSQQHCVKLCEGIWQNVIEECEESPYRVPL